jgi:hypothetical protein
MISMGKFEYHGEERKKEKRRRRAYVFIYFKCPHFVENKF